MKNLLLLLCVLGILVSCQNANSNSGDNVSEKIEENSSNTAYDKEMAEKLGADDYGMAKYVFAFLKKGPNRPTDSLEAAQLQSAHMANIGRMAEEGKLALAGPFLHDGELRGIYIFNVESVEEAKKLTESDPAVQAGSLVMELYPWYGSAGLKQVNELHGRLSKIEM